MTRKDYQLLAGAIGRGLPIGRGLIREIPDSLIYELNVALTADNPNFNAVRFWAAVSDARLTELPSHGTISASPSPADSSGGQS